MAQPPLKPWWRDPCHVRSAIADAAATTKLLVPRIATGDAWFNAFVSIGRQAPARMMNVRVHFNISAPETPKVYAPEFVPHAPHRNPDPGRSLCLWYPHDPADRRWVRSDGLGELFLIASLHLRREHMWQQSATHPDRRVWPGPEERHGHPWSI